MPKFMNKTERQKYLADLRKKLGEKKSGGRKDPFEFRPPKATPNQEFDFYFRILSELSEGDKCQSGVASTDYDFPWYENAAHWMNNGKHECPRIHDGEECPICKLGFDLLNDTSDQEERRKIARKFLPRNYYAVNIYFLNNKKNPEDLRGKVMWMNCPKTVFDIFEECFNNDDEGDPDDPKAFGVFWDSLEGYTFKFNVKNRGEWNNYESSKFLPSTKGPFAKSDGEPDMEKIQKILDSRHDLVTKFADRNNQALADLVKKLVGEDVDNGWDDDEESKPKKQTSKPKPKPKTKNEEVEKDDESVAEDEELEESSASTSDSDSDSDSDSLTDDGDDPELDDLLSKLESDEE